MNMPSICIQLYVLGLLVLMGSRAEGDLVGKGSMSTNSTPTDTPSTASLTPSTANQTPSTASLTPSSANQTPSAANQTPSAANQTPSAANEIAQTTSSGLTALSHSHGWESTATTETISAPGNGQLVWVCLQSLLPLGLSSVPALSGSVVSPCSLWVSLQSLLSLGLSSVPVRERSIHWNWVNSNGQLT
nr:ubiquitin-associated protein 2-like [Salvelinus alpinus]